MTGLDQARIIAIDGPGGAGKSTVARALAARLAMAHLDTGAMYRAVTWAALDRRIDPSDGPRLAEMARRMDLEVGEAVSVDGRDVTGAIRSREVTDVVSTVSAHPEVRAELVRRQRAWVTEHGGGVVEGRDIGSVVFPDARLRVFLTARDDIRARRRAADMGADGPSDVAADLARRDAIDSTRAASPLTVPAGALLVDTSDRGVDEIVDSLLAELSGASS